MSLIWKAPNINPVWVDESRDWSAIELRVLAHYYEELSMTTFYCQKCTARKDPDWRHCPWCGCVDFYFHGTNVRMDGTGIPRQHPWAMAERVDACTKEGAAMSKEYNDINSQSQPIGGLKGAAQEQARQTPEDEEFERAIKIIRARQDNLKRARKQRDKAEEQVKVLLTEKQNIIGENIKLQDQVKSYSVANINLQTRITELKDLISNLQARRPEPIRVRNVYGRKSGESLDHCLPIICLNQDQNGCIITVGLP